MTTTRITSLTALGLLAFALAIPAQAAQRGGWDRNGTSVLGTAEELAAKRGGWDGNGTAVRGTPEELAAGRRGGWDANGTTARGTAAEPQPLRLRAIELPAAAAAASTAP